MIPTIRAAGPKALNRRLFSNSARTNVAVASIAHNTSAVSSTSRAAKIAVYTVLGSTAVVAGASHLLKDEVVYWTPNARK
jgi:hypothetical protein